MYHFSQLTLDKNRFRSDCACRKSQPERINGEFKSVDAPRNTLPQSSL